MHRGYITKKKGYIIIQTQEQKETQEKQDNLHSLFGYVFIRDGQRRLFSVYTTVSLIHSSTKMILSLSLSLFSSIQNSC